MVNSAGRVLSPIVMGSIFTATIDTAPLLLFYVHLVRARRALDVSDSLLITFVHVGCRSNQRCVAVTRQRRGQIPQVK